jgi:hemolysin activation/secretion protein
LQGEGAATLTLVADEKRESYWSRSDNRGGDFVGPYQLELGAAFAGVPKVGQSLSIRGIVTPAQRDELNFLSAVYQTKIGTEGASFVLAGNGLKSEPGKSLKSLELKSSSYGLNGSLNFVPIRSREHNLNLRLGFSYANSDTEALGADFSQDRTRSINVGAEYRFLDRWRGANSLSLSANRGVNLLEPTKDGNALLTRADAVSSATWFRGSLARLQSFDAVIHGVSAQVEVDGQFSIDPLTSSREFGVGGLANASAFDSSEITGDHGLSGRIELRYSTNIPAADEIVPGGFLRGTGLQIYTFGDGGYVWQEGDAVTGQENDKIASAGLGLRINLGQYLSANVEAAQPFGQVVASKGNKDPRIFGQIVARF